MERIANRQNPLVRRFRELARSADAVVLDTTDLTLEQAIETVVTLARRAVGSA